MSSRQVWFSDIQYRSNPADSREGVIDLGLLLEFTTSKYWVVGLAIRAGLDDSKLAGLDELTRKLLEHRADVISREIDQVLPRATEPGHALQLLAAENPWSIHITAPRKIAIPSSVASGKNKTVEEVAEAYVYCIYVNRLEAAQAAQQISGQPTSQRRAHKTLLAAGEEYRGAIIPLPWMFAPKTVRRPLVSRKR